MLASVGYDHVNRVWDLTARRQVAAFEVSERPILSVAVSADGKTIFSGGADSKYCALACCGADA